MGLDALSNRDEAVKQQPVSVKKVEDFINEGSNEFINIDSEVKRTYTFPGGEKITIHGPLKLCVKPNGHRVWDESNTSHYIPMGWIHLEWTVHDGRPNFVK